jgi:5-formyltetrahydrofolate cyclo-ligase
VRYHRRMANDPAPGSAPQGTMLRDAKLSLRREMLARRDALDPGVRAAAGAAIVERLRELPSFAAARTLLLTLPFRSEWDTMPLVRRALDEGKRVAIPRVNALARMLELYVIADPARDIGASPQGIPEPLLHCGAVEPRAIDWVLVPGVTFDRSGRRLGYGGGYYDRLLPLLAPRTPRIVGAFDLQIVERVPAGPHDITIDLIVTPTETIVTAPRIAG